MDKARNGWAGLGAAFPGHELGIVDLIVWGCALGTFFLFPTYLLLATNILVMILFTLSLNLAVGLGGIATLGHAAFFGIGAYAAAFFALEVSPEPLVGLVVAAVVAGMSGIVSGALILRTRGLTTIMLTVAIAALLYEAAISATHLTNGDDGLRGYKIAPLLGQYSFDIHGKTAYLYCLAVLALAFVLCRIIANSPFGLTANGIRENPLRMRLVGVPVTRRLVELYAVSAALAGVAGGLSAQITRIVSVDSLGFVMSGNVLIMLVLGGVGRLYGAFLGAALFVVFSDRAAAIDPYNWLFAVGVLLILVVRFMPEGLIGFVEAKINHVRGVKR